jgi:hypothetical protein
VRVGDGGDGEAVDGGGEVGVVGGELVVGGMRVEEEGEVGHLDA